MRSAARPGLGRTLAPVLALSGSVAMLLTTVISIPTAVVVSTLLSGVLPALISGPLGMGVPVPFLAYRVIAATVMMTLATAILVGTSGLALIPLGGALWLVATRHQEVVEDPPAR